MNDMEQCPNCGKPVAAGALLGLCPDCLLQAGTPTGGAAAEPFTPPTPAELAPLFPQFEIRELIGKGGMGAVYRARQKELDRDVALKILPPAIGRDAAFAERFAREARAMAKLNHPNIVTIFDFGCVNAATRPSTFDALSAPLFFFVMEFVDGVNLRQLLNAGRVAPREALAIVPQICDALQYAHDHGIVHRDIKPENILLDRQGRVKVADFGLAKLVGVAPADPSDPAHPSDSHAQVTTTQAGAIMGTPQYMAPEQREHPAEVDHRADIYSLGVVFYQMLTGELPGWKLEPPSKKVLIDVRLDEVVLRALAQQPGLRYQQVSDVKTLVETIVTTPPAAKTEDGRPQAGTPEAAWESRAPGWRIRCRTCGFMEHWGKYGIRKVAAGTNWTLGWCAHCGRIRIHVIEKGPVPLNQPAADLGRASPAAARLSRTAVAGAICASLGLIGLLMLFLG